MYTIFFEFGRHCSVGFFDGERVGRLVGFRVGRCVGGLVMGTTSPSSRETSLHGPLSNLAQVAGQYL
jgi:hypothetical protein